MKLEDLQKSLLDMTHAEKLALTQEIRADRRISKVAITHKARQKKDKSTKMIDKFNALSKEEQVALLKALQEADSEADNSQD